MAGDQYEYKLRCRALELHRKGVGFGAILERLGRGCFWLAKRTIDRILQRHGSTRKEPRRRKGGGEPYPP